MAIDTEDSWDFISEAPDFYVAMMPLLDLIAFIKSVHEFLPYVADQETIRIKAVINNKEKENDYETVSECQFEIEEITRRKEESWPQFIWGGVLVSIYAAFEHGIEQSFKSWKHAFDATPAFSSKSKLNFITAADEYVRTQIQISLFPDDEHRNTMMLLKALRNSYVHNGCRTSLLPKHIQQKLIEDKLIGYRIIDEAEDTKWLVDARTCLFFALKAKTIIRLFGENGFNAFTRNNAFRLESC